MTCPLCNGPAIHNQSDEGTQSIESVVRWIPVEERLPDVQVKVLACALYRGQWRVVTGTMQWGERKGTKYWYLPIDVKAPTYWMPLPDPPPTENK